MFQTRSIQLLCIVAVSIATYSNTLDCAFVFDDLPNISENPARRLTSLAPSSLLRAAVGEPNGNRPVANLTFAVNYYFSQDRVASYHVVNILIHTVNGMLVYCLALITFHRLDAGPTPTVKNQSAGSEMGEPPGPSARQFAALFAALLFVAHPVQTQSVTYIVQRMNSLAVLFYLFALWCYIRGRLAEHEPTRWMAWAGCGLAWLLALGSKQNAATLPVALLLYECYFLGGPRLFRQRRNVVLLLVACLAVALSALFFLGSSPLERIADGYELREFDISQRVLTQFRVVVFYLSLIGFPHPGRLNLTHDFTVSQGFFTPPTTLLSLLFLVGLLVLAMLVVRRQRLISFCIGWIFIHLAIESSVFPLEMVFEHRLYLPMVGVCLSAAYVVWGTTFRGRCQAERLNHNHRFGFSKEKLQLAARLAASAVIVLLLALGSLVRNRVWTAPEILWSDVVSKSPGDARGWYNRGKAYGLLGDDRAALADYTRAIELKPNYSLAYNNRGIIYGESGRSEAARADFSKVIDLDPGHVKAYFNRGVIYSDLGQHVLAVRDFTTALNLEAFYLSAFCARAVAYAQLGENERAMEDCARAIRLNVKIPSVYASRAHVYFLNNELDMAWDDVRQCRSLGGDVPPELMEELNKASGTGSP